MWMLVLSLLIALALGTANPASAQSQGRLSVSVEGVRNDAGSVRCGLYSSADGFREPGREMRGAVAPIKNGQATCLFSGVPAGTYAVAVFHAERNETQSQSIDATSRAYVGNPSLAALLSRKAFLAQWQTLIENEQ
jgi:uncharacterized protein (DUF2141 family)